MHATYISLIAATLVTPFLAQAARITEETPLHAAPDRPVGVLRAGTMVSTGRDQGEWIQVVYETWDAKIEGYVRKSAVADIGAPDQGLNSKRDGSDTPPVSDKEMALSTYWMNGSRNMSSAYTEFLRNLKDQGSGSFTTRPSRGYTLYGKLTYLMPVQDAIKELGLSKVTSDALKTPGLPADSFTGYNASGNFDGFSSVMLVADRKGQLVALQLGDRDDKGLWLRDNIFRIELGRKHVDYSERWRIVSLFDGRTKGSAGWQLGYIIRKQNGVIELDSELISGSSWQGRSKERYRTIMPEPTVDLLLQIGASDP